MNSLFILFSLISIGIVNNIINIQEIFECIYNMNTCNSMYIADYLPHKSLFR